MSQAVIATHPSAFAVFKNPGFTKMWVAQLVSTIGDSFTLIAAGIYVFRVTGSSLQVGLMLMATSLPTLLIGMIAGVYVDRFDRKKIMVWSDLSRAVLVALIPVLIGYGVGYLYLIVLLVNAISTFFRPAYDSVIPEMASDDDLAAANSMIAISSFGSTAVGFAASGLLAAYSIEWAFYIDGISYLFSGVLLMSVIVEPLRVEGKTDVAVVVKNLKIGVQYLFKSQVLRAILLVGAVYATMAGLGNTLLLPFATQALGATEFEYGIQEGLTSIGFVVGSLILAKYFDRLRDGTWVIISLLGMGLCYLAYSFATGLGFAITMVTLSGVMNAPYGIARRTLVQRHTEREIRGRVMGAFLTVYSIMSLLGMAAAGLADIFGPRVMMQFTALVNIASGFLALVMPGVGQPAAEWLRGLSVLRKASQARALANGRVATLADMDRLAGRLPALSALSAEDRKALLREMRYIEAPEATAVVRSGESSDAAYFILEGGAVAGREENGAQRVLETLRPGDFFGEIAALTGVPRTANVITDSASVLLRVPAETLREMSKNEGLNRLFMTKMTERMVRMNMVDLPKRVGYDPQVMRDMRTAEPT